MKEIFVLMVNETVGIENDRTRYSIKLYIR